MKKYLSVFSLVARESIFRIAFLWIFSAIAQAYSFFYALIYKDVQRSLNFSRAFTDSDISVDAIFTITILLTALLLIKTGTEFRTKSGYTLRRLRIDERNVFLIQSVYSTIMLFLLILFEVVLAFVLLKVGFTRFEEGRITNQTMYLSFYESDFLKNVFCGRDILRIVRNILCVAALGISLSAFTFMLRRREKFIPAILFLAAFASIFLFCPNISYLEWDIGFIISAAIMIVWSLSAVMKRGKEYDA